MELLPVHRSNLPHPIALGSYNEMNQFKDAVEKFSSDIQQRKGVQIESIENDKTGEFSVLDVSDSNIDVGFISHSHSSGWSDPYFGFLIEQLNPLERDRLVRAIHQGNFRIMRLSRKRADEKDIDKVKQYLQHHDDSIFLASDTLFNSVENSSYQGRRRERNRPTTPEEKSREKVLNIENKSIRFYGLTKKFDEALHPIRLLHEINVKSDLYEISFDIALAVNNIINEKNLVAGIGVPASLLFERILEILPVEEQTKQVVSMVFGEVTAMGVAGADRIGDFLHKLHENENKTNGTLKKHLGIAAQTLKNLPPEASAKVLKDAHKFDVSWKKVTARGGVLGLTIGLSMALSEYSKQVNSLWPYAILPILNTLIVTAYELGERALEFKNTKLSDAQFERLVLSAPKPLRPMMRLSPAWALAYTEFSRNKYAQGNVLGSALASLSVLPLASVVDMMEWNRAVIYAAAGSGIESLFSFGWGKFQTSQDVYKNFSKGFKDAK